MSILLLGSMTAVSFAGDHIDGAQGFAGSSMWHGVPAHFENGDIMLFSETTIPEGGFELSADGQWLNGYGTDVLPGALQRGIDVSYHQGRIDWEAVKAHDIDFAILRCGFGSNWANQDDDCWEYNVSECERLGIPYGVYLFSYAYTNTDGSGELKVLSEINHMKRLLHGHTPTLPVYYDLEAARIVDLEGTDFPNKAALQWCRSISAAGYLPGIYANLTWWNTYLTDPALDQYPRWVAQWNSTGSTYEGAYHLWQCASDYPAERIAMSTTDKGFVDLNFAYVEYQPYTPGYWSTDEAEQTVFMGYEGTCNIEPMPNGPVIETGELENDTVILKNQMILKDGAAYDLDDQGYVSAIYGLITRDMVTLDQNIFTYDGNEKEPQIVVTEGTDILTEDTDYTVSYERNIDAGSAFVTVTGIGEYRGSVKTRFLIQPADMSKKKSTLSTTTYTWNGKAKTPKMTVSGLTAGKDYKVTYKANKNVGKASAVATGTGNYTGTITKSFTIKPKGTSISRLSKGKKSFTVKWKKQSAKMSSSRITGYQIRYSTSSSMKNAKKIKVKGYSVTKKKIKKLKKHKKYYVQIRTYKIVSGKTYWSSWSTKKSVKTK